MGYWISLTQGRISPGLYFNLLLLCGKQKRLNKERENPTFVSSFLFFLDKGGLKLHMLLETGMLQKALECNMQANSPGFKINIIHEV